MFVTCSCMVLTRANVCSCNKCAKIVCSGALHFPQRKGLLSFVVYHKGLSFVVYHKGLSFVGNATRCNKCAKIVCSCVKVCKGLFTGMSVPQSAKEMQENDSYSLAFDCLLLKNTSVIFEKRDAKYVEKRRRMCVKEM